MRFFATFTGLLFGFATVTSAFGTPIQGELSFSGSFTLAAPAPAPTTLNLGNAVGFASFSNVFVADDPVGDYLGLEGEAVTMYGFNFTDFPAAGVRWWELTATPTTSFDILSVDIEYRTTKALVLSGLGWAHMAGRESYLSEWTLSANMGRSTFSFSGTEMVVTAPIVVPEGGSLLVSLGLALAGFAGLSRSRRRMATRQ